MTPSPTTPIPQPPFTAIYPTGPGMGDLWSLEDVLRGEPEQATSFLDANGNTWRVEPEREIPPKETRRGDYWSAYGKTTLASDQDIRLAHANMAHESVIFRRPARLVLVSHPKNPKPESEQ